MLDDQELIEKLEKAFGSTHLFGINSIDKAIEQNGIDE